jgi:small-conductance mechanosensitive channel
MDDIVGTSWIANPIYSTIVIVIIILLIGVIVGRVVGKLLLRLLHAIEFDRIMRKAGFSLRAEELISESITVLIYVATLFYALERLGISTWVVYAAVSLLLLLIAISIIINLRELVPGLLAFFYVRKAAVVGQLVKCSLFSGRIVSKHLTFVRLIGPKREELIIPNSLFRQQHRTGSIACK